MRGTPAQWRGPASWGSLALMSSPTPTPGSQPGTFASQQPGTDRLGQDTIARLTHDLRTPLNSIIGFSDLLLSGIGGKLNAKQIEFIDAIHRNGHVLLSLINDMLDWSSIESGRIALRREPVDLVQLLADLRAMVDPVIASAKLKVEWPDAAGLASQLPSVDRKRVLQLLLNLIDNARKFTPSGGHMALAMTVEAGGLAVVVEDSGPGLAAEEMDRIFTPYSARLPQATARGVEERIPGSHGTGLGLSIVRSIVLLHGGTIHVDRGTLGGARFRVMLPA